MTQDRDMPKDQFEKFDKWFRTNQKRGLFVAVCTGAGPLEHAGWSWTELKYDGDEILKLYKILVDTAESFKGTSH